MYFLSDYDYHLPPELIAQAPAAGRENSRLLALDRHSGAIGHHRFHEIGDLLRASDVLVINDTRVIPARLPGYKSTGGRVEVLLIDFAGGTHRHEKEQHFFECRCLVRASKSPKPGTRLFFGPQLSATVKDGKDGIFAVEFISDIAFEQVLEDQGKVPLPPYIERQNEDAVAVNDHDAYQTVYAAASGAVAAPTAGLHFTDRLLEKLRTKGIEILTITLHVSYGTFMPVRADDIREHRMHAERYEIDADTAAKFNAAKDSGKRIISVGTTSVRTLEYAADENGRVAAGGGACDLFIYPGYRFKAVDAMITNFHLPRSTLLMLVSAFAGRDRILNAYQAAIDSQYRFYSYGDAMFIR